MHVTKADVLRKLRTLNYGLDLLAHELIDLYSRGDVFDPADVDPEVLAELERFSEAVFSLTMCVTFGKPPPDGVIRRAIEVMLKELNRCAAEAN
jgi:hypothetical protein